MAIAESLDKKRKAGKLRGPLHGIPVLIKDNINTGDKIMTTAGSLALTGNYVNKDDLIIKKLREAGAKLLWKKKLSKRGCFRSTRQKNGLSRKGGETKKH